MFSRLATQFIVAFIIKSIGLSTHAMELEKKPFDDGSPLVTQDKEGNIHSENYDLFRPLRERKVDHLLHKLTELDIKYKSFLKKEILHGSLDLSGRLKNLNNIQKNEIFNLILPLNWLYRLILSRNELIDIPLNISQFRHLKEMDLSQNNLKAIPLSLWSLTTLEDLDLSENKIQQLHDPHIEGGIGQLVNLKTLNLFENQITTLPKQIGELKQLTELHLLVNQLHSITPRIGELKQLTELNLRHNNMTDLPKEIWQLTSLKELSLGFNQLTSIHPHIGKMINLTHLDLTYNKLSHVPETIKSLSNIQTLDIEHNDDLLLHSDSVWSWGRRELKKHFKDSVILSPYLANIMDMTTTKADVYDFLDNQPLRVNRDVFRLIKLPTISNEQEIDGNELIKQLCQLLGTLNFNDDTKSTYLSYATLAQDLDKQIREDHGVEFDQLTDTHKIFRFILPRITGYFKSLYGLPMSSTENYEWRQMNEENRGELKKSLVYLIQTLNNMQDNDQKAIIFTQFVHGLLHCPTGQKEGIDTVILSLMGQQLTGLNLENIVLKTVSINKNAFFKKAILLKGWDHPNNVHLISTYEEKLRDELGVSSSLGAYHEKIGTLEFEGFDPFSGNVNNVLKVFYDLVTPQVVMDWLVEKAQTTEDLFIRQKLNEKKRLREQQQSSPMMTLYKKRLENQRKKLLDPETLEGEHDQLTTQISFLEQQITTLQSKSSLLTTENLQRLSNEIADLKDQDRLAYQFRPITTGDVLNYLVSHSLIFPNNPVWLQKNNQWWQNYFSADPLKDELSVLTLLGGKNILLHMGLIVES